MIFNPFSLIPANPKSHVRGWAMVWAELLGEDFVSTNNLYLDHGVNFGGNMNMFGGVTETIVDNLTDLLFSTAPLISLDIAMPNYAEQLEKRLGQATCHPALVHLLPELKKRFNAANSVCMYDLGKTSVTIGDSHATAFSPTGSAVIRTNGQTLYGAIKDKFVQAQLDLLRVAPERVTIVLGSIDIRHHIGRQESSESALAKLCNDYSDMVKQIEDDYLVSVEVAAPVPVEFEDRRIPKTGFYKGTAFTGSQIQRSSWTEAFIGMMKKQGHKVIQPPKEWYQMDPKNYAESIMELSSSVHISPVHYRRYSDWLESV